jgi:sortase A
MPSQGDQPKAENQRSGGRGAWLVAERVAWALGLGALAIWGAIYVAGVLGARQDLKRFDVLRASQPEQSTQVGKPKSLTQAATPDLALWDMKRVKAWQAALTRPAPSPLAVLRIPRIRLEVAVLPGTDDFVLDRAVGHIEDTALPGTDSNCGIAGHRDGFFRGLKDIAVGDAIELETLKGREMYHVERTWIVAPEDVSVLDPTRVRALTLVTCYPFYFIGSAPQRFIVRAVRGQAGIPMPKG